MNRVVTVDDDAAGYGWLIDEAQWNDVDFRRSDTSGQFAMASEAKRPMDLLTVLAHELGHILGLADHYDEDAIDGIMHGLLKPAVRRLPAAADVDSLFSDPDAF